MIRPEVRAEIRRLFYAEHWKVGTIAAALDVHHDTVERALELLGRQGTPHVRATILDPYKDFIREVLEKHPRLRATRVYEMVKARGYEGSAVQVRRYVNTVRPVPRVEAYLRRQTLPGEEGQVDWAAFGKWRVGNALRPLSCFVIVLSHSRAFWARFLLEQTLEPFLREHVKSFEAFGGVPRDLLYDNLKSVVLERQGDAIRFHPRLLELAGHYHFAPKPCAPYRGNEKGKVERTIRYLRDSFFAGRSFGSVAELNEQLSRWLVDVAYARRVPGDASGRTVRQALEEERAHLLPLPQHRFEADFIRPATSGKTPYIRFDGNDYSVPDEHVKRPLTLAVSENTVRLLDGTREVARHARCWDKGQVIEDAAHLEALAKKKRHAAELRGRDLLRNACKNAEPFILALAQRGGPLSPHTTRLLGLLERYGAEELDAALAEALARGAVSAPSVAHLLDTRTRQRGAPPPLDPIPLTHPRAREVRITPHSLSDYGSLCTSSTDDDNNDDSTP
jgi:transposase